MSCSSLRHKFEDEKSRGLTFRTALDLFNDVKGSVDGHKAELEELRRGTGNQERINHLHEHIRDGEALIREIETMILH